jgi:hypothetical protein
VLLSFVKIMVCKIAELKILRFVVHAIKLLLREMEISQRAGAALLFAINKDR